MSGQIQIEFAIDRSLCCPPLFPLYVYYVKMAGSRSVKHWVLSKGASTAECLQFSGVIIARSISPGTYIIIRLIRSYVLLIHIPSPQSRGILFHLYLYLYHMLIYWRIVGNPHTTNFPLEPYNFCTDEAARTNSSVPCSLKTVWWIATSDCYDWWGFFRNMALYFFEWRILDRLLVLQKASRPLTSCSIQYISFVTLRLNDTHANNFSCTFIIYPLVVDEKFH